MKTFTSLQALLAISIGFVTGSDASAQAAVGKELQRLAADYTADPGRKKVVFGIDVGEERSGAGPNAAVQVQRGNPQTRSSISHSQHLTQLSAAACAAIPTPIWRG